MPEYMQQDCFDCGLDAMERCKEESKIAEYIKKEFDRKYSQTWHCIVGSAFGYFVTHETSETTHSLHSVYHNITKPNWLFYAKYGMSDELLLDWQYLTIFKQHNAKFSHNAEQQQTCCSST
jgi:hypothetical protein